MEWFSSVAAAVVTDKKFEPITDTFEVNLRDSAVNLLIFTNNLLSQLWSQI